jgi:DNA invertase Pin-like site-specific DNA recombinase
MVSTGKRVRRVAIYTRVSTKDQTTENQLQELHAWAARAGHTVVKVYEDAGISGAKGRDQRPGFDAMLKAAVRREFDMLAVWSSDRLGRSLRHLVEVLETIRDTGTGLYIHTQSVDTTTPAGRAMFGMLGIFAELEREMIQTRIKAGMDRVRAEMDRNGGKYTSRKSGVVRRSLGRPGAVTDDKLKAARAELANDAGIVKSAKLVGLGTGTVHKLRREMSPAQLKRPAAR